MVAEMAWCGLVALAIAQNEGACSNSPASEHRFLSQWLTKAYKQKRFSKALATYLELLIRLI